MLQAQSLRLQFVAAILKEGSAAHTPTEGTGAGSARCQSYGSPWSFLGGSSGASRRLDGGTPFAAYPGRERRQRGGAGQASITGPWTYNVFVYANRERGRKGGVQGGDRLRVGAPFQTFHLLPQ